MTSDMIPRTMMAVRLHAPGGRDHLVYEKIDTPVPAAGEALVRVHAAAITRDELDWPVERLPAIPSYELSGTVVATGGGTGGIEVGQSVFALTGFEGDGVAAEYAAVPAERLALKPQTLSHVESAALPLPGLSAMQGLFDHGLLQSNQRVLIHGAAGGVGQYAVQLAKLHGAHVIGTTSAPGIDIPWTLGADTVIDYTATDFAMIEPVSLVFDTVGGDRLARSVSVIEAGGRLVSIAEEPPELQCAEHEVTGVYFVVEPNQTQLVELARLADEGLLHPAVDTTFPLALAREAFLHLHGRAGSGKVVLTIADE